MIRTSSEAIDSLRNDTARFRCDQARARGTGDLIMVAEIQRRIEYTERLSQDLAEQHA